MRIPLEWGEPDKASLKFMTLFYHWIRDQHSIITCTTSILCLHLFKLILLCHLLLLLQDQPALRGQQLNTKIEGLDDAYN